MKFYIHKSGSTLQTPEKHEIDVSDCQEVSWSDYCHRVIVNMRARRKHPSFSVENWGPTFYWHRKYLAIGAYPVDCIKRNYEEIKAKYQRILMWQRSHKKTKKTGDNAVDTSGKT